MECDNVTALLTHLDGRPKPASHPVGHQDLRLKVLYGNYKSIALFGKREGLIKVGGCSQHTTIYKVSGCVTQNGSRENGIEIRIGKCASTQINIIIIAFVDVWHHHDSDKTASTAIIFPIQVICCGPRP